MDVKSQFAWALVVRRAFEKGEKVLFHFSKTENSIVHSYAMFVRLYAICKFFILSLLIINYTKTPMVSGSRWVQVERRFERPNYFVTDVVLDAKYRPHVRRPGGVLIPWTSLRDSDLLRRLPGLMTDLRKRDPTMFVLRKSKKVRPTVRLGWRVNDKRWYNVVINILITVLCILYLFRSK